jgi:hypothetical protein
MAPGVDEYLKDSKKNCGYGEYVKENGFTIVEVVSE